MDEDGTVKQMASAAYTIDSPRPGWAERDPAARGVLQPKDWLRMQLTGEALSEPTDASATLLYDLESDGWSREVVRELDLRVDLLPDIVPSFDRAGGLKDDPARQLGLQPGIPVAAGAADAASPLVGHGIVEPGAALLTVGTGAQITAVRKSLRPDSTGEALLYRSIEKHRWYAMAAILNAGLALAWVRDLFRPGWSDRDDIAIAVPPGAVGVTFVRYLVHEGTTRREASTGASWSGIAIRHRRPHLLMAGPARVAWPSRPAMEALDGTGRSLPRDR